MDFMHDTLSDGRSIRVLTAIDLHNRECLSQHKFIDLRDAQRTRNEWQQDYNNVRPHSALNNTPPVLDRTGGDFISDSSPLRNWRP